MPRAAVRHAQSPGFLPIPDCVQIHRGGQNIDDHFATGGRDYPGSQLFPTSKLKADRIHGIDVAGNPQQSIGKGIHDPDEVAMGLVVKMTPVNQVNLFTRG